jgi:hypothetical protein
MGQGWQVSTVILFVMINGVGVALGEAAAHFPKLQPTSTYLPETSAYIICGMATIDVTLNPTCFFCVCCPYMMTIRVRSLLLPITTRRSWLGRSGTKGKNLVPPCDRN